MTSLRRSLTLLAVIAAILAFSAAPSSAVVGGTNAGPNEFPAVAEITFGAFLCTGTLIAPTTVLSAGHCGSVTGAAVASPASWPPAAHRRAHRLQQARARVSRGPCRA